MPYIFIMGLLLPPILGSAFFLRCKPEQTAGLYVIVLVLAGYMLSIFGLTFLAPWLIWAGFLAGVGSLLYGLYKQKLALIKQLLTPGLVVFVGLCALAWWMCRGHMYSGWDEFSHWGRSVKNMFELNALYTLPTANTDFKEYPPALTVLQYMLLKAMPFGFREDIALFAPRLLTTALLVYPLGAVSFRKPLAVCAYSALLLVLPVGFYESYYTHTTIDVVLGMWMAGTLLVWALPASNTRLRYITFALSGAVLCLLKVSGTGLAVMVALLALLGTFVLHKSDVKRRWQASRLRTALFVLGPLGCVLAAMLSWNIHLQLVDATTKWDSGAVSIAGIIELFSGSAPAYRYEVLAAFGNALFVPRSGGGMLAVSFVGWMGLFCALGVAGWFLLQKQQRKSWVFAVCGQFCMMLLFAASLLVSYLFVFSEIEAVGVVSFQRYTDTLILSGLLFLLGWLFVQLRALHWIQRGAVYIASAAALAVTFWFSPLVPALLQSAVSAAETHHLRYFSQQNAARINAIGEEAPRVYFVSQLDDGRNALMLDYELSPHSLPAQYNSIGVNYEPSVYIAPYTPQQWAQVLHDGFDYVYLFNLDGNFVTEYSSLFEDPDDIVNGTMLWVDRTEDGSVVLRRYALPEGV